MKDSSSNSKVRAIQKKIFSTLIEKNLDVASILSKSCRDWDGGYVMAGMIGHGDAFVIRIRLA